MARSRNAVVTEGLKVHIRSLGAGGEGVGRLPDGRTVFVPRTAPGDVALIEIERERPRWARARAVEVVTEAEVRRAPPCALYSTCGGCQLQHITYAAQLDAKRARIRDALTRIGGRDFESIDVPPVHPSPRELGYRGRARFHLRRTRGDRVFAGFHQVGRPNALADLESGCPVLEPALETAWRALREGWGAAAERLPRGRTLELVLRNADSGVGLTVLGGSRWADPDALLAAVPPLNGVWWRPEGKDEAHWVAGVETLSDTWNGEALSLSGSGFLQANREGAMTLWTLIAREIGKPRGKRVVDAYCGVGVYGRLLARHGAEVVGVELDPAACAAAAVGAPGGFAVRHGRVEDVLPEVLPADLVITNPPRQGMHADAVSALLQSPPMRLVYVSCDPATLARDLAAMSERFEVIRLQAVDLFPQTAHVETLVTAVRRAGTAGANSNSGPS